MRHDVARQLAILAMTGVASGLVAYSVTRLAHRQATARSPMVAVRDPSSSPYASGSYLVAYVFVSSGCGFSTERRLRNAVERMRAQLRSLHGQNYAAIKVIGVAVDASIEGGMSYMRGLKGSPFDEIDVGGGWLNELFSRVVWQDGVSTPELPQVVLVQRTVDATPYPQAVVVTRDSTIRAVVGRDSLLAWVDNGMPLAQNVQVANETPQ